MTNASVNLDREWLRDFYRECGREVSLAYSVLNQTHTWGVSLTTALLTASGLTILAQGDQDGGFLPNRASWLLTVVAWVVMLRFFARSALAYVNLYRWNTLSQRLVALLSVPEGHFRYQECLRDFRRAFEAYYVEWKSPVKKWKIVKANLQLMFGCFMIIVLGLFIWGAVIVRKDWYFVAVIAAFVTASLFEVACFAFSKYFKYIEARAEVNLGRLWGAIGSNTGDR